MDLDSGEASITVVVLRDWLRRQRALVVALLLSGIWLIGLYLSDYPVVIGRPMEKALLELWRGMVDQIQVIDVYEDGELSGVGMSVLINVTKDGESYLGFAQLHPGPLGRYRLVWAGTSFSSLLVDNYENWMGIKGFRIAGINPGLQASEVVIQIGKTQVRLNTQWQDHFVCWVPAERSGPTIRLYSGEQDITDSLARTYPNLNPNGYAQVGALGPHSLWTYVLVALGPLAVVLAVNRLRRKTQRRESIPGEAQPGM